MIKIFVTGDNHIGLKFDRFPDIKEKLIESRIESIRSMVHKAEEEKCDLFVITGDLFDRVNKIKKNDVKSVVQILSQFGGNVLVLPGNHDYYAEDENGVWKDFAKAVKECENNIKLITKMEKFTIDIGDEIVTIYPALCQSKHSHENNLDWIKSSDIDVNGYNIGIAHGTIEGVSPDIKNEYFSMGKKELENIPVDVWLIGHAHISYPDLPLNKEEDGYKIFNAGTHEQTDFSNNTEGNAFIVSIDNECGKKIVSARKIRTGNIRFYDLSVSVDSETGLKSSIERAINEVPNKSNSIIRLTLSGTARADEYAERRAIYRDALREFMTYEVKDDDFAELITKEKIRAEFPEIGFAARLLEELKDPKEVEMAYKLLNDCRK